LRPDRNSRPEYAAFHTGLCSYFTFVGGGRIITIYGFFTVVIMIMPSTTTPASTTNAVSLKSKSGLKRLWHAARYSLQGLRAAWRHEAAFRQEILLVAVLLPIGFWLGKNGAERALLTGSVLLILVVELLNSGLEAIVDKTSPDVHELAGRAKDMGSAAVFFALLLTAAVWGIVLLG
jgi:diacylglycerol kinase (ATP)